MLDSTLDAAFRTFAAERKYSPASIDRWRQLAPADAAALLAMARDLRLGENQLRDLWEWTDEIARRDHLSLSDVLAAPTMTAARSRQGSRNDKLKFVKGALRRLRFPQLAAVEEQLAALVRTLALPRNVQVTLPECLEGDTIRIEIAASDVQSLRAAAAAVMHAADTSACAEMFHLLEEAP